MIEFVGAQEFGDTATNDIILSCGELHSMCYEAPAEIQNRREFYKGTRTAVDIITGYAGRDLVINALINDASFVTRQDIEDYMYQLDQYHGMRFTLKVTVEDPADPDPPNNPIHSNTWADCYLHTVERVKINDIGGVALPNYIPPAVGPAGNFWQEVNLTIRQVTITPVTVFEN